MATARQRWTQLERRLWTAFRRGDVVDVRDAKADPTHIWGPTRTVRAEVVRELLFAGPASLPGRVSGLQLTGARITGPLDLAHGEINQPFAFYECWFDEPIRLSSTRTRAVFIQDCRVPGIIADGLRVDGELNLDGILCTAGLNLIDAHVSGPLVLNGAELSDPDGVALIADGAEFGNDVLCRNGFRAAGVIRLPGARIEGDLDLSNATVNSPTDAVNCGSAHVSGDVSVNGSVISGEFSLMNAQVGGRVLLHGTVLSNPGGDAFSGDGLHAAAGLLGRDGLQVTGEFRLPGARIGGILSLSTAVLSNPGQIAFMAARMVMDGNVFFTDGFTTVGEMSLLGARVHGQLSLSNATLSNPGARALLADEMAVDNGFFGMECHVEGEIHVIGARVASDVDLTGAVLVNDGSTLTASGLDVSGNLFCGHGFNSTGDMDLSGARIGLDLSLRGATLRSSGRYALQGRQLAVGHDIVADEDLTVRGTLDLSRGRVAGAIWLATDDIEGEINLAQTRTDRLDLTGTPSGRLNLTDATVRILDHDPEGWPEDGEFDLHGLTYTTLKPLDLPATRWLDWLRRGLPDGYRPQPYAQLATTLRNVGNDRDARVVLLARQRHRRRHLPLWSKPWGWLQDVAVGYGYVPWRAAGWLAVLWLAGWAYFQTQRPLPGGSNDYQPALYALDLLLPVLSIGQRSTYHFTGPAQLIAVLMTVCSWILGIAVLAGLTRALTRN